MYHPPSKKRQFFMRSFIYTGMTIAIVLLVGLLLLYMLGYRLDQTEGKIEQSGLLQYVTTPNGATVEVDSMALPKRTPTKSSVSPGQHEFVMWREGYETWRKSLTIQAGTLTWLNYARLVPKNRPVVAVASLPKVAATLASPTDRFMAVLPNAALPTVNFYDLGSEEAKQISLTLPTNQYTDASKVGVTHHFEFVEWDASDRYLLVKHRYNDKVEWLVLDRQDAALESNLTKTMDIPVAEAHFAGTSGNVLFVLSGGDVRKVDLSSATLSRPFASEVAEFNFNTRTNIVSFVSTYDQEKKQRTVGLVRDSDKESVVIKKITSPPSVPVHVGSSRYFNQDFFVVSEGKKVSILSGSLPSSSAEVAINIRPFGSFTFVSDVQWLQTSDNGRFVTAQTGANYSSYDLERKTTSPVSVLAGTSPAKKLRWLDDYYVWSDRSDALTIREFDGTNQYLISSVATGFDVSLSPDGTYLYSIGRAGAGFQLQRVKMILN